MPWDFSRKSQPPRDPQPRFSSLRPYEDPIIINTTLQNPAQLIKVQHGVHGTTMELLQHLHTSLRVGRFNRAEAIIQRLAEQSPPTSPEVLHAHTAYLEEFLRTLASQSQDAAQAQSTLKSMQRWFEVEVMNKGVQPDAKVLVVLIRAAIRALDGKKRDRAIRRYADLAETLGPEIQDEVLYSEDYDDNEFTILGRATSELYEEEETETLDAPKSPAAIEEPLMYTPRTGTLATDEIPDVLPTEQKSSGLSRVKRAMQTFIDLPPLPLDAPVEPQRERAYERQRLMEETSVDIAIDHWREADEDLRKIGIHTAMQSKPMAALMWQWYQALLPALEKELAEVKRVLSDPLKRQDDERYHYGPFLELLPIQSIAANTILFVMTTMASGKSYVAGAYESETKLSHLTTGLAKVLEAECCAEASKEKLRGKQPKVRDSKRARNMLLRQSRHKNRRIRADEGHSKALDSEFINQNSWPLAHKVKLGAMLIQRLIESAHLPVTREHPRTKEKMTQMQPAFLHRTKYVNGKKVGVFVHNPALTEKLESEPIGSLLAKRMPMIVEPKPWTGWNKGGYLHYPNPILRLASGDRSGMDYFLAADTKGSMKQVYTGLTALGKVPWKVYHDVFKVQLEAWNSGESIANFAPLRPNFDVPPEPKDRSDPDTRRKWLLEIREFENKRAGLHSKRCFQNFQMEIARTMANETLYFPHSLDFRGRAYPIPPYLNHMGADNVRALLVFAEGKELGETGLRWLKIHMATVAGFDKASLDERVQYTMDHLDDIYDSARNPLGGRRWWLKAEDAWQTLAACFELTKAMDSPDPTKFVSTLPVQQDGTCNGLQHYAALGGDEIGARQVNLEPGDRPADVYTAVAEAVKEEVRKDAEAGNPVAQKLDGRITRKCVKRPVMTNVYGVTFYGAKEQVAKELEIIMPEVGMFDPVNRRMMSHYITTKIFKSLGTMFGGAQAIQHWLGQAADRIATCLTPEQINQLISVETKTTATEVSAKGKRKGKAGAKSTSTIKKKRDYDAEGLASSAGSANSERDVYDSARPLFKSTVVWTTPLRLPVVQPYRKSKSKEIKTNLQTLALQEPQVWDPVSKRKQLQAFPPNFIHSLDATHMLLSAMKCNEVGMTFASIHDSFWTHACDVNSLNVILRDAFVEMHSEDIIGRLREEFQTRYKGCMHLAAVLCKSPVGERITQHRHEMKDAAGGKSSELTVEVERIRLLDSEDPEERAKGEAMVTPGSIFASESDESALAAPTEMAGQALGDVPDDADYEATNSDADADEATCGTAESSEGIVGGSVLGTDTDALAEAGSAMTAPKEDAEEQRTTSGPRVRKGKRYPRKLYVWLPMKFPEVPAKGGFDVTRLRASKYFFH